MDLKDLIFNSKLSINQENIDFNKSLKEYTTFKIGGPAECLIKIKSKQDLLEILNVVKNNNIDFTIIGNGSNLLVLDKGIKGIVALNRIEKIQIIENKENIELILGAGTKMSQIAIRLLQEEITGFEELSGIPGTIGGAVIMNAGAHGKEIKDIIKSVTCIDLDGIEHEFNKEELVFEYRNSNLKHSKYIITEVKLMLNKGKKKQIQEKMEQYKQYRIEKQPIEYPSAGSTFKRGEDYITAKLIDEAGLKGYRIGGAEVSTKHSGFIINKENATAKDVIELISYIKEEIKKKFDKDIKLEIEIIGQE